jgi:hypothetical protein
MRKAATHCGLTLCAVVIETTTDLIMSHGCMVIEEKTIRAFPVGNPPMVRLGAAPGLLNLSSPSASE